MKSYIDILLVAIVTIYIVDLSGFTDSWRSLVATKLGIKALKPLPPFDCGLCMTWWVCVIYSLCTGSFSLGTLTYIAVLSFLSIPIGQVLIFIKEAFIAITNKLIDLCSRMR